MARCWTLFAQTLMLSGGIARAAETARANDAACFGGAPEVVTRNQPLATDLRVHGRKLFWTSEGRVRSLDLDRGTVAVVGPGDTIPALNDRYVAAISARNRLSVLDRRTGRSRVLVDGFSRLEDALVSSSVGLDSAYAYFGRTAPEYRKDEAAGFFRVPLDGHRRDERLAMEPDGATPFVVGRGEVVWLDAEPDAIVVHRRSLVAPGSARRDERRPFGRSSTKFAPTLGPLRLLGDELFFTADDAVWSVALDRQEPVRQRVGHGWTSPPSNVEIPVDLAVHGPCAYYVVGDALRRARLGNDAAPETLAAAERLGEGSLATDGRHLYWPSRDGNIMRSAPAAAAHAVQPPRVARPAAVQPNRRSDAYQVVVGDDFGCALLVRDWNKDARAWRCWRAGAATQSPRARVESFAMPGLDGLRFSIGAGRVCIKEGDHLRCLPAGQVLDSRGQALRPPNAPPPAGGKDTAQPTNDFDQFVGGTFSCTSGPNGWRCTGDDTYGQRAGDALAEPARSAAGRERATSGALGAWHGCVSLESGKTACWGRNDVGQLGHVSPDTCRAGDVTVPCTRSPRETAAPYRAGLLAGDQFTCAQAKGLWCWGGSRDGVFGTAGACAPGLRQAWPTRAGSVSAPSATCAPAPVQVAGFSDAEAGRPSRAWKDAVVKWKRERGLAFGQFSVGPRGICGTAYGKIHCRGAVPTPAIPAGGPDLFYEVLVNTGDRPSACATNRRSVICWGAGYSPVSKPNQPVEIDFEEGTSSGAPVVDAPPPAGGWPAACLVHHACLETPLPLPTCAARSGVPTWNELRPRAPTLVGTQVVVRGALGVGRGVHRCLGRRPCCTSTSEREIVVGVTDLDADGVLALAGPTCRGDDSRLCCAVPAYGQQVRVEGTLARDGASNYGLQSVQLCQEPAQR